MKWYDIYDHPSYPMNSKLDTPLFFLWKITLLHEMYKESGGTGFTLMTIPGDGIKNCFFI